MIKKMIRFIIKRKVFFVICLCCILGCLAIIPTINTSVRPKGEYTIVIDAGHGGRDGAYVHGKHSGSSLYERLFLGLCGGAWLSLLCSR